MHQPIEALPEPCDIERIGQGKACGATGAPEGLKRACGLALQPALQGLNSRRGNMAAEAIEPLDADQRPEAASALLEKPKQAERMADGDGVRRPVGLSFRAACDEAEIDEGDVGATQMRGEAGPNAGMEAPAMNEHEMHFVHYSARTRRGVSSVESTSKSRSISDS